MTLSMDSYLGEFSLMISDSTREVFELINLSILTTVVCLLGIVSNTANIIVFYKQGLKSTVNISFMALSITDLCNVILIEWVSISSYPMLVNSPDVMIFSPEVSYITSGFPHGCMTRISAWITVYMTAERCLCIAMPFKVKRLITPNLTISAMLVICLMNMLSFVPQYLLLYLDWKFFPQFNETRIGLVVYIERQHLDRVSMLLYFVLMVVSFTAVLILSIVLIIQLKRASKWRKASQGKVEQSKTIGRKDKTVVRTVLVIACVLIVTFTPNLLTCLISFIEPGYEMNGQYRNAFIVNMTFAFLFDAINSSINTLLYYNLNSSYKDISREILSSHVNCFKKKDN